MIGHNCNGSTHQNIDFEDNLKKIVNSETSTWSSLKEIPRDMLLIDAEKRKKLKMG
jgi:hypothetical protein